MKARKKLHLHIGSPKTGTTFLQSILYSNEPYLESKGFGVIEGLESRSPVAELEFVRSSTADEISARWRAKTESQEVNSFILSQESYTSLSSEEVAKLARALSDVDVQVIRYMRRQDELIESSWKQWHCKQLSFDEFVARYLEEPYDLLREVERWSEHFGDSAMTIRCYEKGRMPDGIEMDFFAQIDENIKVDQLKIPEKFVNTGFDRDSLEIMYLGRELLDGLNDNRFHRIFSQHGQVSAKAFQKHGFLTSAQRQKIMSLAHESNRRMAQKYLKEDGDFFSPVEEINDPPYPGLNKDEAIKKLLAIALSQQETIESKVAQNTSGQVFQGSMTFHLKQAIKRLIGR